MKRHLSLLCNAQLGAVPMVTCGVQTSIQVFLVFAKLPYMLVLFRVSIKIFCYFIVHKFPLTFPKSHNYVVMKNSPVSLSVYALCNELLRHHIYTVKK